MSRGRCTKRRRGAAGWSLFALLDDTTAVGTLLALNIDS